MIGQKKPYGPGAHDLFLLVSLWALQLRTFSLNTYLPTGWARTWDRAHGAAPSGWDIAGDPLPLSTSVYI